MKPPTSSTHRPTAVAMRRRMRGQARVRKKKTKKKSQSGSKSGCFESSPAYKKLPVELRNVDEEMKKHIQTPRDIADLQDDTIRSRFQKLRASSPSAFALTEGGTSSGHQGLGAALLSQPSSPNSDVGKEAADRKHSLLMGQSLLPNYRLMQRPHLEVLSHQFLKFSGEDITPRVKKRSFLDQGVRGASGEGDLTQVEEVDTDEDDESNNIHGKLELDETDFVRALRAIVVSHPPHQDLHDLFRKVDANGHGVVSYEQFVYYLLQEAKVATQTDAEDSSTVMYRLHPEYRFHGRDHRGARAAADFTAVNSGWIEGTNTVLARGVGRRVFHMVPFEAVSCVYDPSSGMDYVVSVNADRGVRVWDGASLTLCNTFFLRGQEWPGVPPQTPLIADYSGESAPNEAPKVRSHHVSSNVPAASTRLSVAGSSNAPAASTRLSVAGLARGGAPLRPSTSRNMMSVSRRDSRASMLSLRDTQSFRSSASMTGTASTRSGARDLLAAVPALARRRHMHPPGSSAYHLERELDRRLQSYAFQMKSMLGSSYDSSRAGPRRQGGSRQKVPTHWQSDQSTTHSDVRSQSQTAHPDSSDSTLAGGVGGAHNDVSSARKDSHIQEKSTDSQATPTAFAYVPPPHSSFSSQHSALTSENRPLLAVCCLDRSIRLLDASSAARPIRLSNAAMSGTTASGRPQTAPAQRLSTVKMAYENEVATLGLNAPPLCMCTVLQDRRYILASGDIEGYITAHDATAPPYQCLVHLRVHQDAVTCMLAIEGVGLVTGSLDNTVGIFDPQRWVAGPVGSSLKHDRHRRKHTFNPLSDARYLRGHNKGIYALAFSQDIRLLATGGLDRRVVLWNPYVHNQPVARLTGHRATVVGISFNDENGHLYSTSSDMTVRVWDMRNLSCVQIVEHVSTLMSTPGDSTAGRIVEKVDEYQSTSTTVTLTCSTFDQNRRRLLTGGTSLYLWDITRHLDDTDIANAVTVDAGDLEAEDTGSSIPTVALEVGEAVPDDEPGLDSDDESSGFDVRRHSRRLAKAQTSAGKTLRTLDAPGAGAGGLGHTRFKGAKTDLPAHTCGIVGLEFSSGFRQFVSVGSDASVRVWDASSWPWRSSTEFYARHPNNPLLTAATLDASERRLVTAAADGSVCVWNFNSGAMLLHPRPAPPRITDDVGGTELLGTEDPDTQWLGTTANQANQHQPRADTARIFSRDYPRLINTLVFLSPHVAARHPLVAASSYDRRLALIGIYHTSKPTSTALQQRNRTSGREREAIDNGMLKSEDNKDDRNMACVAEVNLPADVRLITAHGQGGISCLLKAGQHDAPSMQEDSKDDSLGQHYRPPKLLISGGRADRQIIVWRCDAISLYPRLRIMPPLPSAPRFEPTASVSDLSAAMFERPSISVSVTHLVYLPPLSLPKRTENRDRSPAVSLPFLPPSPNYAISSRSSPAEHDSYKPSGAPGLTHPMIAAWCVYSPPHNMPRQGHVKSADGYQFKYSGTLLHIYSLLTGAPVREHAARVPPHIQTTAAACDDSGKRMLVGDSNGWLYLWDANKLVHPVAAKAKEQEQKNRYAVGSAKQGAQEGSSSFLNAVRMGTAEATPLVPKSEALGSKTILVDTPTMKTQHQKSLRRHKSLSHLKAAQEKSRALRESPSMGALLPDRPLSAKSARRMARLRAESQVDLRESDRAALGVGVVGKSPYEKPLRQWRAYMHGGISMIAHCTKTRFFATASSGGEIAMWTLNGTLALVLKRRPSEVYLRTPWPKTDMPIAALLKQRKARIMDQARQEAERMEIERKALAEKRKRERRAARESKKKAAAQQSAFVGPGRSFGGVFFLEDMINRDSDDDAQDSGPSANPPTDSQPDLLRTIESGSVIEPNDPEKATFMLAVDQLMARYNSKKASSKGQNNLANTKQVSFMTPQQRRFVRSSSRHISSSRAVLRSESGDSDTQSGDDGGPVIPAKDEDIIQWVKDHPTSFGSGAFCKTTTVQL